MDRADGHMHDRALLSALYMPHFRVLLRPPLARLWCAKPRPSAPCALVHRARGQRPRWRRRASAPCCGCSTSSCATARPRGACRSVRRQACAHHCPAQRDAVRARGCVRACHAVCCAQHVHGRERAARRCAHTAVATQRRVLSPVGAASASPSFSYSQAGLAVAALDAAAAAAAAASSAGSDAQGCALGGAPALQRRASRGCLRPGRFAPGSCTSCAPTGCVPRSKRSLSRRADEAPSASAEAA